MSGRSVLMWLLVAMVFAAPIVYHEVKSRKQQLATDRPDYATQLGDGVFNSPSGLNQSGLGHSNIPNVALPQTDRQIVNGGSSRNLSAQTQIAQAEQPFQTASFNGSSPAHRQSDELASLQQLPSNDANRDPSVRQYQPQANLNEPHPGYQPQIARQSIQQLPVHSALVQPVIPQPMVGQPVLGYSDQVLPVQPTIDFSQMTPDYGAAQTFVFPGNAYGPDLTAQPLENLPVIDFNEIFRFDISRQWIQQRWKRVSTVPATSGLSGMRVALVTGTNSWDLHGSLTYYFDEKQQLQRISFRGWGGDPQKLLSLLTSKFSFAQQPTTLAGFYLAKSWRRMTGGLLMKTPTVLQRDNLVQQLGLVMEINNPDGPLELSEEFRALIAGSQTSSN